MHIYTEYIYLRAVCKVQTARNWCELYLADTIMMQHHPSSMQRAAIPAQLPVSFGNRMIDYYYE